MPIDIDILLRRSEKLYSSVERTNTENVWRELSEFLLNNQFSTFKTSSATSTDLSGVSTGSLGDKTMSNVYESTGLQAVQDLSAAMQGTLMNPVTVWSDFRFETEELNDDEESVFWLADVNKIMHRKFNESNLNTEAGKAFQSFVSLGNMALFHEQKEGGESLGFKFTSLHLGQLAWAENKDSVVDTVYRKFSLSAKQAFDKWGTNIADGILKFVEKNPDKSFEFMHCIYPREDKDIELNELGLAPGNKRPYASVYIDMSHKEFIDESGYYEFPIYVVRWSLMPGETTGRGPGHLALPDVRSINKLRRNGLEATDLTVMPPILANQRDIFGQLDMRPRGISIVKNVDGIKPFQLNNAMDILKFSLEDLRQSIRSMFFLDKLLLPPRTETGEMTAFEIAERTRQMQAVLGPVVFRVMFELLQPLVLRAFKVLLRSGQLPEMPQTLKEVGVDVEITFSNQLARAQNIQDLQSIQQWLKAIFDIARAKPAVLDLINEDGIAKHIAQVLGVPEEAINNTDTIDQIRQQRAQQQQQQQMLESANLLADTAAKAGNIGTQ